MNDHSYARVLSWFSKARMKQYIENICGLRDCDRPLCDKLQYLRKEYRFPTCHKTINVYF